MKKKTKKKKNPETAYDAIGTRIVGLAQQNDWSCQHVSFVVLPAYLPYNPRARVHLRDIQIYCLRFLACPRHKRAAMVFLLAFQGVPAMALFFDLFF
jgi:hypothetical protein